MSTNGTIRHEFGISSTHPGLVPPGEIWFANTLGPDDYLRLSSHENPVVSRAATWQFVVYFARGVLDGLLDGDYDDDEAAELDDIAEIVADRLAPRVDLAKLTRASVRDVLAAIQAEAAPDPDDNPLLRRLDALIVEIAILARAIADQGPPLVKVEMPPANPTPVNLVMPNTKRKRKFTTNAAGEIDGLEDADE